MTLIDGDRIITAQLYDDEHEEFTEKKMSIIDYINAYTDEGVTEADVVGQTDVPDTNVGELISRQAVIDRINRLIEVEKKQGTDDWGYGRERVKAYEAMLYMVKSEYIHPSVEPERKPVKWIDVPQYRGILFECDFCHKYQGTIKHKYCPNCGAKMEVET